MSRQRAINAKCKDCIYDPLCGGGTWRQQTEACTITACALWPYRPRSRKSGARSASGAGEIHAPMDSVAVQERAPDQVEGRVKLIRPEGDGQ